MTNDEYQSPNGVWRVFDVDLREQGFRHFVIRHLRQRPLRFQFQISHRFAEFHRDSDLGMNAFAFTPVFERQNDQLVATRALLPIVPFTKLPVGWQPMQVL